MMDYTKDDQGGTRCHQNCTFSNETFNFSDFVFHSPSEKAGGTVRFGEEFYAYGTPVIFMFGICGNSLSLGVFLSKSFRYMSCSRYLIALSVADISTLIFYVLSEWLRRGLKIISPGHDVTIFDTDGVCQIWLYFSYISRFLSSWLLVCLTCERFISICVPLRRKDLCSLKETSKVIAGLFMLTCVIVVYKPTMSTVITIRNCTTCTSKENFVYMSFILDSIFALLTFFVPFCIILSLNALIIKRLIVRNCRNHEHFLTEENYIRLEFTLIMLVTSFVFMILNLPYFVLWVYNFMSYWFFRQIDYTADSFDYWLGVLSISRTIFYMNYCINFFVYCVTGTYFRRELRGLFSKSYTSSGTPERTVNEIIPPIELQDACKWV